MELIDYDDIRSVLAEFVDGGLGRVRPLVTLPTENLRAEINPAYDCAAELMAFLASPTAETWTALAAAVKGE